MEDNTETKKKIMLTIRKRTGLLFQGEVSALTSFNRVGDFDVLPEHARFVSLVNKVITVHLDNKFKRDYKIDRGIISVKDNNVEIYVGV